jgi:hypothetical protein
MVVRSMRTVEFVGLLFAICFTLVGIFYTKNDHRREKPKSLMDVYLDIGSFNLLAFLPYYVVKVGSFIIALGILYAAFFVF